MNFLAIVILTNLVLLKLSKASKRDARKHNQKNLNQIKILYSFMKAHNRLFERNLCNS